MPDTQTVSPDIQKVLADPNFLKLSGADQVAVLKHMRENAPVAASPPPVAAAPPQQSGITESLVGTPTDPINRFTAGALRSIGLPTSISNIPDWAAHLVGLAPDSKPFWDDIHQAAKNPTQENLVKAVPIVGPTAVSMAQSGQQGDIAGVLGGMLGVAGGIKGAQMVPAGLQARQAEVAANSRIAAYSDLNKAIPATKSAPYTPQDLQNAHSYLLAEHGEMPITNIEGLRDAADGAIRKIEGRVQNAIEQGPKEPMPSTTLENVKQVLAKNARGAGFVKDGLKDLQDFNLDEPKTLAQKDAIRQQLNAENKAILRRNNYDVDTARKSDPGFAAREAAAESLRNDIYDTLDKQGNDTRSLRQDEGSLIKIRNATQNQMFNAEKKVTGTSNNPLGKSILASVATAGGVGVGAGAGELVGHPIMGAMIGERVGSRIGNLFKASNLTRDELVERAFSIPQTEMPKGNPTPFAQPQPSGAASIGDILKSKGFNPMQLNQQPPNTPGLPFHPNQGLTQ